MNLDDYLIRKQAVVENALKEFMPEPTGFSARIADAMAYSLFAGGKRLRPILCIAGAETVGGDSNDIIPVACALEMIHTYSLIHDDLPAMDDDDFRRGKPANHKVYGDAIAILAGDGLLTEAFNIMTKTGGSENVPIESLPTVIGKIAVAAGYQGMVGGQSADIEMQGKDVDADLVKYIHTHKTGALISVSVTSGAILGRGSEDQVKAIQAYGDGIGLAFQIADDILDIEGDSREMGKSSGSDEKKGKITYPSIFGLNKSKEILRDTVDSAIGSLEHFDSKADPLRLIASYIIERRK